MVRRSAFGRGFDESLRVGEDVDLEWRLVDQGWLVRYDARRRRHPSRSSVVEGVVRQRHDYGESTVDLVQRHGIGSLRFGPILDLVAWTSVLLGQPAWALVWSARPKSRPRDDSSRVRTAPTRWLTES